jgi:hypothetical protein
MYAIGPAEEFLVPQDAGAIDFHAMPETLTQEERLSEPVSKGRRRFLFAAAALAVTEELRTLLAQEAPRQPRSANELLRALPKEIILRDRKRALVEKTEVADARHVLIAIRQVHELPKKADGAGAPPVQETAEGKEATHASNDEVGRIIAQLQEMYGVRHLSLEGFTEVQIAEHEKNIARIAALSSDIRRLAGNRQYAGRVRDARDALKIVEEDAQKRVPFTSVLDLLRQGKLRLIAAETVEARAMAEMYSANPLINIYIPAWIREDASLSSLSAALRNREDTAVATVWGAAHWRALEGQTIPARIGVWNAKHADQRISTAVITPPAVAEYLRTHPMPDLPGS